MYCSNLVGLQNLYGTLHVFGLSYFLRLYWSIAQKGKIERFGHTSLKVSAFHEIIPHE